MTQRLSYLRETASQTCGPFEHIGLAPWDCGIDIHATRFDNRIAGQNTRGERIRIEGRILDGLDAPLPEAMIELWQANSAGRYNHPADIQAGTPEPGFRGWGRCCTDGTTGLFSFDTVKPGVVTGRHGVPMAPHVNLWIVARGINIGYHTRMYFADEAEANAKDPVLAVIEWEARRKTLVASRELRDGAIVYRFDIRLQGPQETVFFDI